MMKEPIFALDIGTRSVTGIILHKHPNNTFDLVDYYIMEHEARAMLDGQIHNVVAVANTIKKVKEKLQKKHGGLESVCVAAAGRSLKTVQATASLQLNGKPITDEEMIKHLELSAVNEAQLTLAQAESTKNYTNYYCVGYSIIYYKLDDEYIGSLIDQSGNKASVEIIATFLPKIVVESLLAALDRAELKMAALTLEPIAAIDVLIPESMRKLNVALVDIGAGTSDIAITDKGTIVAYGMVPIAGDEITEAISEHYLLDFPIAEQTKRNIVDHGEASVSDILGFNTQITYNKVVEDIMPSIENLTHSIAEEIIRLNAKAPKAIMLIGGGSLTPELTTTLANKLQLPPNRVAIRGIDAIQNLTKTDEVPDRPDFVTPIGIAIAATQNPVHYVTVYVNDRVIRMFEMKQLTVGDALVHAGINLQKFYGKPGIAFFVTVNKKNLTLPGEFGHPPIVSVNDKPVTVEHEIRNGDRITITKGMDGRKPTITINELIGDIPVKRIYFNEQLFALKPKLFVNDEAVDPNYCIRDNDAISIVEIKTVDHFLTLISAEKFPSEKHFFITVNGRKVNVEKGTAQLTLNGKLASVNNVLHNNDQLILKHANTPTVEDLLLQLEKKFSYIIEITFNGQTVVMSQANLTVTKDEVELSLSSKLTPGDHITIIERNNNSFIFQDVFRYVDIDLNKANGNFQLYKNNAPTSFDDVINHGDQLTLSWE